MGPLFAHHPGGMLIADQRQSLGMVTTLLAR
jgi:hypothetical protein